jgi:hypothetical protein
MVLAVLELEKGPGDAEDGPYTIDAQHSMAVMDQGVATWGRYNFIGKCGFNYTLHFIHDGIATNSKAQISPPTAHPKTHEKSGSQASHTAGLAYTACDTCKFAKTLEFESLVHVNEIGMLLGFPPDIDPTQAAQIDVTVNDLPPSAYGLPIRIPG